MSTLSAIVGCALLGGILCAGFFWHLAKRAPLISEDSEA